MSDFVIGELIGVVVLLLLAGVGVLSVVELLDSHRKRVKRNG